MLGLALTALAATAPPVTVHRIEFQRGDRHPDAHRRPRSAPRPPVRAGAREPPYAGWRLVGQRPARGVRRRDQPAPIEARAAAPPARRLARSPTDDAAAVPRPAAGVLAARRGDDVTRAAGMADPQRRGRATPRRSSARGLARELRHDRPRGRPHAAPRRDRLHRPATRRRAGLRRARALPSGLHQS